MTGRELGLRRILFLLAVTGGINCITRKKKKDCTEIWNTKRNGM